MTRALVAAVAATAAATLAAVPSAASPEDPFGEDWVAIALAPETGNVITYGSAGSSDEATGIAMSECTQRSAGHKCRIATAIEYGCAAGAINVKTFAWSGGRGPDLDSAVADAMSKLPPFDPGDVAAGGHCSNPVTPP